MTLRELIVAATAALTSAGVDSPRVDAELLAADLLGIERSAVPVRLDDAVETAFAHEYDARVERRASREPLQYIVGYAPFRHVLVRVGPGVFIPRPETELLVDAALPMLQSSAAPVVVDLCSGSGALALSVADEVPGADVIAVEADPGALEWLSRNAAGTSIEVVAADVTAGPLLPERHGRVDVVLSNPPYVPDAMIVGPEVRSDPAVAVFGGPDGLDVLPSVIARAAELLRPGGLLVMEHENSQGRVVPELLRMDGRWREIADHRDLSGRARFAVAVRA